MKRKKQLFFDHLAKTGGTTVYQVLKTNLGEDAVTDQLSLPHREMLIRYGWKRLISAHTMFQSGDSLDPARYYFTILREPLDRALSHYWYRRSIEHDPGWTDVRIAKSHSFEEMLYSDEPTVRCLVANVQARHYANLVWDKDRAPSDSELLDAAKSVLDRFDLVGVNEELEDMLLVVGADCGIPISKDIPRLNVTKERRGVGDLGPNESQRFAELNAVDIELHKYAGNLFRQHRRRALREAARRAADVAPAASAATAAEACEPVSSLKPREIGGQSARIDLISIQGHLSETGTLYSGEVATLLVQYGGAQDVPCIVLRLAIYNDGGQQLFSTSSVMLGRTVSMRAGKKYMAEFTFRNDLAPGNYLISVALDDARGKKLHGLDFGAGFQVGFAAGYYFEGMVNLNPGLRITCNGKEVEAAEGGVGVDPASQRQLGVATPPLTEFKASVTSLKKPSPVMPGELFSIEIELANQSRETWRALGSRPVQIGYRWARGGGGADAEGLRTRLPRDVGPGESLRLFVHVRTPSQAGAYKLRICLVQEYVAWFDDHQTGYLDLDFTVG
ncbi:MAG: Wzt carbohydrate-binding domain-containing protein [Pseudomonadota bacterium]